jgi:hypothetical protein
MVFVSAAMEVNVPVIRPLASVIPDGVSVFPVPVADRVTVAPLTRLSKASRTITVMVEILVPLLAVIGVGAAVAEDRLALGAAVKFTVCVTGGETLVV